MSFMDELRKLTQPYDDEDDFYEGADGASREQESQASPAQMEFESAFAADDAPAKPEPAPKPKAPRAQGEGGGLFGGFVRKSNAAPAAKPRRERTVNFNGSDQDVVLFNPKSFEEAGELVGYLEMRRSVVMTLEGVQTENARRLLDFLSGIAFALNGKITPISAKTYFVTPQNVNVLGSGSSEQPESEETYL